MDILIGVDGSEAAATACRFVASRPWPVGTTVGLVAAHEPAHDLTGLAPAANVGDDGEVQALSIVLDERAAILRRAGLQVVSRVGTGPPTDALMREASDEHVDLIVVGSRRLGPLASAILGSVSAHLVDHAACPVLVVRSPGASRMLLATDGSDSCRNIPVQLGAWGAAFRDLPVEVLSVAARLTLLQPLGPLGERPTEAPVDPDFEFHERVAQEVADEMMDLGWHTAAVAAAGDPEHEILAAARAWRADLIVTGSRGLGTIRRLLIGSLSHDLLMHSQSSLLVMRGRVPARSTRPALVAPLTSG